MDTAVKWREWGARANWDSSSKRIQKQVEAQASKNKTKSVVVESGNAAMQLGSKSQHQVELFLEEGEVLHKREIRKERFVEKAKIQVVTIL